MAYVGDIAAGATVRGTFNTRDTDGAPITLTSGTLRVYKDDGTTEDDSGITLNTDFDSRTGLHLWEIDTSSDGTFYAAGADYFVVVTVGTVDSVSVVGTVVGHFSIDNRSVWNVLQSAHVGVGTMGQRLASIRSGTATAGAANTITLDGSASTTADFYVDNVIQITAGTGAGQARIITAYSTGRVATVAPAWTVNPSSDSVFIILPGGSGDVTGTVDANIVAVDGNALNTSSAQLGVNVVNLGGSAVSAASGLINANVTQISGDSTAADNLESYTDGTTPAPVNVIQVSGDATAADNLEAYTDGSTPMPVNAIQISGDATAADNAELFYDGTGYNAANSTIGTATNLTNKGDGSTLTAVPWNSAWDAEVQSEVADELNAAISDSIPADGSIPSIKQALYMLTQFMVERDVVGTTVTVKKADGSTSLFTLALNDANSPTQITRAS